MADIAGKTKGLTAVFAQEPRSASDISALQPDVAGVTASAASSSFPQSTWPAKFLGQSHICFMFRHQPPQKLILTTSRLTTPRASRSKSLCCSPSCSLSAKRVVSATQHAAPVTAPVAAPPVSVLAGQVRAATATQVFFPAVRSLTPAWPPTLPPQHGLCVFSAIQLHLSWSPAGMQVSPPALC